MESIEQQYEDYKQWMKRFFCVSIILIVLIAADVVVHVIQILN